MTDLQAKFDALESQLTTQNTAIVDGMTYIATLLNGLDTTLTALNNNQAANTRYILNALAQIDPCVDCAEQTPIVPPITGSAPPIDEDKCKRVQAMLATVGAFADGYTTLQSYNVVATVNVVNNAITAVISGISGVDTVPLPSFPEAVNLVGDYLSSVGTHIFDSSTPDASWAVALPGMLELLYAASTPADMQAAFAGQIDAADIPAADKLLLKGTAYNALWSYMFDPASTPDLTPYDGSICGSDPVCMDIVSQFTPYGHWSSDWTHSTPPLPEAGTGDLQYATPMGAIAGWTVTAITTDGSGIRAWRTDPGGGHDNQAVTVGYVIGAYDDLYSLEFFGDGPTPWTMTICPPE
jgi:hypothetical protein